MAGLEPDVRVFRDPEALSHAAAEVFVETAGRAVQDRGQCLVALSGGQTPKRLYALLAQSPYLQLVDWAHLQAFWGDERCVPAEDLNSNYRQAHDILLSHVPVKPENIHRVRTELGPELAAEDYAHVLRKSASPPFDWPRFDLVLLGLGEDGHTASLFPGSAIHTNSPTEAVSLPDREQPGWRITLTPMVFNSARRVLFLVQGAGKSAVVASVLYGERKHVQLVAQRIRPNDGELIWMLDTSAAAFPAS